MRRTTTLTIALALLLAACGSSSTHGQASADTATIAGAETTARPSVPSFLGSSLQAAQDEALATEGIDLTKVIDLGPELGHVSTPRLIDDPAAWTVIGQCPVPGTKALTPDAAVGVIPTADATDKIIEDTLDGWHDPIVCDLTGL